MAKTTRKKSSKLRRRGSKVSSSNAILRNSWLELMTGVTTSISWSSLIQHWPTSSLDRFSWCHFLAISWWNEQEFEMSYVLEYLSIITLSGYLSVMIDALLQRTEWQIFPTWLEYQTDAETVRLATRNNVPGNSSYIKLAKSIGTQKSHREFQYIFNDINWEHRWQSHVGSDGNFLDRVHAIVKSRVGSLPLTVQLPGKTSTLGNLILLAPVVRVVHIYVLYRSSCIPFSNC